MRRVSDVCANGEHERCAYPPHPQGCLCKCHPNNTPERIPPLPNLLNGWTRPDQVRR